MGSLRDVRKLSKKVEIDSELKVTSDHYVETTHDFEVKFKGCYGIHEKQLGYFHHFESSGDNGTKGLFFPIEKVKVANLGKLEIEESIQNRKHIYIKMSYDENLLKNVFVIPKKGFVNTSLGVIFVERTHKLSGESRYKRGFRSEHVECYDPCALELNPLYNAVMARYRDQETVLYSILTDLYNPQYFKYDELMEKILSFQRVAGALSSSIAIRYNGRYNSIVIMKNKSIIGDYDPALKAFKLRTMCFYDDLYFLGVPLHVN